MISKQIKGTRFTVEIQATDVAETAYDWKVRSDLGTLFEWGSGEPSCEACVERAKEYLAWLREVKEANVGVSR